MHQYKDMVTPAIEENIARTDSINSISDKPEFMPEDVVVEVSDDGDVIISEGPTAIQEVFAPKFDDNIVSILDHDEHEKLCSDLIEKYEQDREARRKRDKQYEEGMRKAGVDPDASTTGADFEGSSEVVHPMLSKACVDFQARSIKELCPLSGPVKTKIIGEATSKKVDESQRKAEFYNEVLLNLMPYRSVLQQMLSQLPLGGSQFIKFWYDPYLKRPNCEFLPIDYVYIPYSANDFYTAERVTIRMEISQVEYWRRVKEGVYQDEEFIDSIEDSDDTMMLDSESNSDPGSANQSKTARTNNKVEGKEEQSDLDDSIEVIEQYVYLNISNDEYSNGGYAPYIVMINTQEDKIIGLYRNWAFDDKKMHKLDYIVKFDFIPWRGSYALGIGQLMGSLSTSATGALRALLDSAHVNNMPTAMGLKGIKMAGQSPDVSIGSINLIEGPNGMEDDIKKCIMPLPFNPPSGVLFELLQFLTTQADAVVKMPDGIIGSMGDRTPANTTLAMIEQASTTQSAIHQNLHFAQGKCFQILGRLFKNHFDPDGYPDYLINELKINASLFEHTRDIIPVSDPDIFCEVQRYAQVERLYELSKEDPQSWNKVEIYKRMLQLLKIPQPELLLNMPIAVTRSNAVAENAAAMLGNQIQVYPEQNHIAHLTVHIKFLKDQVLGANPVFNQNMVGMIEHIKEHIVYLYTQIYQQTLNNESGAGVNIYDEDNGVYDQQLADATPEALAMLYSELAPLMQDGQQVLQMLQQMQQMQQQQNMNPDQIKLQIEQTKLQEQQIGVQIDQQKLQIESAKAQNEQSKTQIAGQEMQSKIALERMKAQNQQQIEAARIEIERMRAQSEIEMTRLQREMERDESNAQIYIEMMRVEQAKIDSLNKIELEREKHHNQLEVEEKKAVANLHLDEYKHNSSLKSQERLVQNSKKNANANK